VSVSPAPLLCREIAHGAPHVVAFTTVFFSRRPPRRRRFYTTIYPFYMGFLRVFPSHKKKSNKGELSFDIFRPNMNFLSLLFFQVMYFQMRFLILL
jgi:hypothetical protein